MKVSDSKQLRFLMQNAPTCTNPHHLNLFAWNLTEGSDLQDVWNKIKKLHWNVILRISYYHVLCVTSLARKTMAFMFCIVRA